MLEPLIGKSPNVMSPEWFDDLRNITRILDKKLAKCLFQEQSFGAHQKPL
ncbi:hypothetical protein [Xenorhabdus poinarii]|nr:hypothetical protein [Xenorhabdus poinarii]